MLKHEKDEAKSLIRKRRGSMGTSEEEQHSDADEEGNKAVTQEELEREL